MSKRITKLSESACSKCPKIHDCDAKVARIPRFQEIKDGVFGVKGYRYRNCPLYISLTAPDMVELEDSYGN